MNTSNQPKKNDAKQKKSDLKAWRPLKLRILDIGQNTRGGTKVNPSHGESPPYTPS